jgi:hypothetical protein
MFTDGSGTDLSSEDALTEGSEAYLSGIDASTEVFGTDLSGEDALTEGLATAAGLHFVALFGIGYP